jgi:hypothetical protein
MTKSFFGALKNERVHRTVYPTRRHAMTDIARYRIPLLHSRLGYKTSYEIYTEHPNRLLASSNCALNSCPKTVTGDICAELDDSCPERSSRSTSSPGHIRVPSFIIGTR